MEKGIQTIKTYATNPKGSLQEQVKKEKWKGNQLNH